MSFTKPLAALIKRHPTILFDNLYQLRTEIQVLSRHQSALDLLVVCRALETLPEGSKFRYKESAGEENDNRYEVSYEIHVPKKSHLRKARTAFGLMGFDLKELNKNKQLSEYSDLYSGMPVLRYRSEDDGGLDREIMDDLNVLVGEFMDATEGVKEFVRYVESCLPQPPTQASA